ncbi:MAG: NAD-dependent epimerase/dehydratase family protein [Alphaproteobacteria bacterium]|jgi:UDP-glucuronate 4-epimerase|nr:NAD-dependent epimerase/dehydratase family protein [Alphaproteobacteria bacterium]
MRRALITGSAGFIGFHLARALLAEGWRVWGYDGLTAYYDVGLKRARHEALARSPGFTPVTGMLEDAGRLAETAAAAQPEIIVHLAAQPGVRYSLENPRAYLDANVTGSFNVLEIARAQRVRHLLMASTSSVYGANTRMPYGETDKADTPLSFYAATKKAGEAMSHAWAHIHDLPITQFRFFTVYGPWGRPDMALFKFTRAILADEPIDVYNHGEMYRDFTYVDDLVRGIRLLIDVVPARPAGADAVAEGDSLSPVAPWRVVNIGNSETVRLEDFIAAVETAVGSRARRRYLDIQPGEVPATWADAGLLHRLTGYRPQTGIGEGVAQFVAWYRDYYG